MNTEKFTTYGIQGLKIWFYRVMLPIYRGIGKKISQAENIIRVGFGGEFNLKNVKIRAPLGPKIWVTG